MFKTTYIFGLIKYSPPTTQAANSQWHYSTDIQLQFAQIHTASGVQTSFSGT